MALPSPASSSSRSERDPIAIVGTGMRLPGGIEELDSLWELLDRQGSAITEVPPDRWNADRYFSPDMNAEEKMVTKWGGFLDHFDEFDASFFGITPREAIRLDPQQRWLLETSWEAVESSGIPPSSWRGSDTGVFVGISTSDYGRIQMDYPEKLDLHTNIGSTPSIAANRISYLFDLGGPSLAVDTACSSAMVAVHLACRSIWSGECSTALAGGVNALILPEASVGFSKASMLSPSGQCFAFDSRADGYVRSEGAGMFFLRPLSAALADGQQVLAVIRSSVANQDGRTSSMPVPGLESQKRMIREAIEEAGVSPAQISYVEAHGTGTPVGDPIETRALGESLSAGRTGEPPCPIGSVKTNVGHLETASGVAGILKAILVLQRRRIPANRDFISPNPNIPFDDLGLEVVAEPRDLPEIPGAPPCVLVNSFGFGGTNGCVVLEAPPVPEDSVPPPARRIPTARPLVLPLSARSHEALREVAEQTGAIAESLSPEELPGLCLAAATRREHHPERLVVIAEGKEELVRSLRHLGGDPDSGDPEPGHAISGRATPGAGNPVFVFTGQGSQWWAMGRQLLEREPVFREEVEKIDALFSGLASWSLVDEMLRPEAESRIDRTEVAQPAIFALQSGLVALWESWGVRPARVIGHSIGEVAAARAAGILSREDATRLVHVRSRLQATTGGNGGMFAAGIPEEEAAERIAPFGGALAVAAVNSPGMVTIAGDSGPLESLFGELESEGVFVHRLPIGYAFHTHQMDPIEEEFRRSLEGLAPADAGIPMVSTVTGQPVFGAELGADYWWRNVREPVRFGPAVETIAAFGDTLFLEIGPHPSLRSSLEECLSRASVRGTVLHSLKREADESLEILANLAAAHVRGIEPDWAGIIPPGDTSSPVSLPRYPWQRERYWLESPTGRRLRLESVDHPLLGMRQPTPNPTWEISLDPRSFPYLDDHTFWGRIVFPVAGFAEILLAVARCVHPGKRWEAADLEVHQILFLSKDEISRLRIECENEGDFIVRIYSRFPGSEHWNLHASGRIAPEGGRPGLSVDLAEVRSQLPHQVAHWDFYEGLREAGYPFGPTFRQVERIFCRPGESLAQVVVPPELAGETGSYQFHPAALDACFQAFRGGLIGLDDPGTRRFYLPGGIRSFRLFRDTVPSRFWVHTRIEEAREESVLASLVVYDGSGERLAEVNGFRLDLSPDSAKRPDLEGFFYRLDWQPFPLPAATDEEESGKSPATGTHLVFCDRGGVATAASETLAELGHRVVEIRPGREFSRDGSRCFTVDPESHEDLLEVFGAVEGLPVSIAHFWCLDHREEAELDAGALAESQSTGVLAAAALGRALANHRPFREAPPRVRLFTRNTPAGNHVPRLASAPLTGLVRVANSELPGNAWTVIALEPGSDGAAPELVLGEMLSDDEESEVSYQAGERCARRMVRVDGDDLPRRSRAIPPHPDPPFPFRLETARPGNLSGLEWSETSRREPGEHEVEIRVHAAGLNFRDLMKALAMYPGSPEELRQFGDDFSGVVIRTGSAVDDLRPGDPVCGIAEHAFRSCVVARREQVFRVPASASHLDAATLPTVFLTAHHCLLDLARMRSGESILIHAGTGGVGQAAIQIAKRLGLEIFATAGTEEKRALLREQGVPHVMDSRTLAFADEIEAVTGGRGVDCVLNSLSGEFLVKSLSVLAPFGRFVEIGKVDIQANRRIAMRALEDNASCFIVDMARYFRGKPEAALELVSEVEAKFENGHYLPIHREIFPAAKVEEAFRFMARGLHVGKIVIDLESDPVPVCLPTEDGLLFRDDATYLVSGGTDGFGLEIAKWITEQGARNLVLLSRRGAKTEEAAADIEDLRCRGIEVTVVRADICDPAQVRDTFERISRDLPELGGVFHAAMVIDDGMIGELTPDRFRKALHPKMLGAWNLHEATASLDLDHFVCISSFTDVLGGLRQSNYAAGNLFLDELARYRKAVGLPGLSINWGPIVGAGYIERNERTKNYILAAGAEPIPIPEAMRVLRKLLRTDSDQVVAARIDWNSMHRVAPAVSSLNLYSEVRGELAASRLAGSIRPLILSTPPARQQALIEEFLTGQIAEVFGSSPDRIDLDTPVTGLGLDSLMSIELVNRLESSIGVPFPLGTILNGPTIRELSEQIRELVVASATEDDGDPGTAEEDPGDAPPEAAASPEPGAEEEPRGESESRTAPPESVPAP